MFRILEIILIIAAIIIAWPILVLAALSEE
jgi:hypothetical protein